MCGAGVIGTTPTNIVGSVAVVDEDLSLAVAKKNHATVRGPLDVGEVHGTQFLAPHSVAVHGAHDDGTILVDDADLLAILVPPHVRDRATVAIVNHLLVPHAAMEQPDHDEPVLVARGQLLLRLIPGHSDNSRWRRTKRKRKENTELSLVAHKLNERTYNTPLCASRV